jgi:hypothetical protein
MCGAVKMTAFALLLSGCFPEVPLNDKWGGDTGEFDITACQQDPDCDGDGDGVTNNGGDCDDADASVNPTATEVCDGQDNNCDGDIDEDLEEEWHEDFDGDGFGNEDVVMESCAQPEGYVPAYSLTDCDDEDPTVYPLADEVCDGLDNDCDGDVDEEATDAQSWFYDGDGDGFGDEEISTTSCSQPTDYVSTDQDCDDSNPDINPNADEICDEDNVDEDCDGLSDDDDGNVDTSTYLTWYADMDSDGFGEVSYATTACDQPTGYVANGNDCDDSDATVNPSAREVCGDGIDNDCNIANDESGSDWYEDLDEDSYGDSSGTALTQCADPSDSGGCSDGDVSTACYVIDNTDCDDTDADTNPAATEYCDGADNDCDGTTDESDASDAAEWYVDSDSDGFGDASATTTMSCSQPSGYTDNADDCNDSDASINPDATEICDSADTDEDCNGYADDADSGTDSSTQTPFYADSDSDGYGGSTYGLYCDAPSGYVSTNGDCEDTDASINPGATEVCDADDTDEDCDGAVDDDDSDVDTSTMSTFYADADLDGYGDASSTTSACDESTDYVSDNNDCDDTNADINPGATEVCDEADEDEDCDGSPDDMDSSVDASTMTDWYPDADSDGYGDSTASATAQCDAPSGYVADNTDCDDADASSTTSEWYADSDGDGFGDASSTMSTCTPPSGYVSDDQDCDDTDDTVNPDSVELYFDLATGIETDNCDGVDSDCDGTVDEGCTDDDGDGTDDGAQLVFACDLDGDGYENSLCFPQAFTGAWEGEDCIYTLSPFTSITTAAAKTPVSVDFGGNTYDDVCYINGGGSTGSIYISAVSAIGSDGSSAVDTTDTSDWIYADFGWCDYYASSYCYGSSTLPSGWAAQFNWDGTEVTY